MNDANVRTSPKVYRARPPANCRAARWAWDEFTKERPEIALASMRLVEGWWMGLYSDGHGADQDAIVARDRAMQRGQQHDAR